MIKLNLNSYFKINIFLTACKAQKHERNTVNNLQHFSNYTRLKKKKKTCTTRFKLS